MKKLQKLILFVITLTSIFFSIVFAGCCEDKQTQSSPIIILHGGGGYENYTYLNAQETFDLYYNQGYRYFEYDLQLSSDGRLIGTHSWDYLEWHESITYQEFIELKLSNGFTPVNEEWLMQTIISHPDIKVVVDAKMPTTEEDAKVLQRLEVLENIYNYDISSNIIPEIFSKEMWDITKETTSFDQYFFSYYKVYYTVDFILKTFSDERIIGIAFDLNSQDKDFIRQLYRFKKINKKLFIFTPQNNAQVKQALALGADGIYVDLPGIIYA